MHTMISQIGPLFYPLLGLSVLGAVLIIERLIFFLRLPPAKRCPMLEELRRLLRKNGHLAKDVRDELVSVQLEALKPGMEYGVRFLRIIAVLSPMLGLLGTVLGMIASFGTIAAHTGPVAPAMIAQGLWQAMLTTAYGLIIALPTLFAAFVYMRLAERRLHSYQDILNRESLQLEGAVFEVGDAA